MKRSNEYGPDWREPLDSSRCRSRTGRRRGLLRDTREPNDRRGFLAEYERVLELLVENQQLGPHAEHGMRLFHFDRFPYTIIYEENARLGPQIFAVSHQRREPDHWVSRL